MGKVLPKENVETIIDCLERVVSNENDGLKA
jgi:hypothetical protein